MLIPRHLNCEIVDDDAIIINVVRALKSDFLTKKLAALPACIYCSMVHFSSYISNAL